jgi:hypothetical protein
VLSGCGILLLAGVNGLLAWFDTIAPRDQLRHVTGQLQELVPQDTRAGAFKITLASGGALDTFEFENAHRLVALLSPKEDLDGRQINPAVTVALAYYPFGRAKQVVDVTLGQDNVLSYEDVARLAAEKVIVDRNTAIGFGALGALFIFLGSAARIAGGGSGRVAGLSPCESHNKGLVLFLTYNEDLVLFWLVIFGGPLVVILADPTTLHRKFGVEALHLPIEYVLSIALALLFFLPLWLSYLGLSAVGLRAMRDGWGIGKTSLIWEIAGLIWEISPLWFFIYPILFWIVFAMTLGGGPSAP